MDRIRRRGSSRGLWLARVAACVAGAMSVGWARADAEHEQLARRLALEAARAIEAAAWAGPGASASPVLGSLDEIDEARARAMLVGGIPERPASAWRAMRAGARADAALARLDDECLNRAAALLVHELALARLDGSEGDGVREGWPASLVAEVLAAMPPPVGNPLATKDTIRAFERACGAREGAGREQLLRDALARLSVGIALRDRWLATLGECGRHAGCAEGRALVELARARGLVEAGWSEQPELDESVRDALPVARSDGEMRLLADSRPAASTRDRVRSAIAAADAAGCELSLLRRSLAEARPVERIRVVAIALDADGAMRIGFGAARIDARRIDSWRAGAKSSSARGARPAAAEAPPSRRGRRIRDVPLLRLRSGGLAATLAAMERTDDAALERHRRQMQLPGFGAAGQERLRAARVLVVGAGALGSVVLEQLCRGGVGSLVVVDRDVVEPSNLQRQTLYAESDAERRVPKAEAARARLRAIDATVAVRAVVDDLHAGNALRHAERCDVLVDCVDNFEARYLLNDCSVRLGVPLVYGGAVAMRGMSAALFPACDGFGGAIRWSESSATPCLCCLAPEPPPPSEVETCETAGVLASAAGIVGSLEAASVLRMIASGTAALAPVLVRFDLSRGEFASASLAGARDPECECCARRRFVHLGRSGPLWRVLCGRNAVETRLAAPMGEVDAERAAHRLATFGSVRVERHGDSRSVRCELASEEIAAITLVGSAEGTLAIVEGTTDPERARAEIARLVGV
jgi:adenylyltransferase/sulfurtransferase